MGVRQARRLGELEAALRGDVSNQEAAARLGISRRQFVRLKKRFRKLGAKALIHGNHGRPSGRRVTLELRQQVVDLLEREVTLNDCHVRDLLEEAGVSVSADTVRRIRGELGRPPKQRRRSPRYLRRRERSAREGTMVLVDGSPHAWLGTEQPILTLVGMIEDATGKILALTFRPAEDLHGYAHVLASVVREYGVPDIVYGDGTSIAVRNDPYWTLEEELAGEQAPSHFGQMLRDLDTRYIRARSPEAKGRIERLWRTLQDRLTSELAMRGIPERDAAEAFLPDFIARHNRRFAVPPSEATAAWRRPPREVERIFSCRYRRTVQRDHTIQFYGERLSIPPGSPRRVLAGCEVEVRELLDGRRLVLREGRVLLEEPAPAGTFFLVPRVTQRRRRKATPEPVRPRPRPEPSIAEPRPAQNNRAIVRPPQNHPWKKRPFKRQPPAPGAGAGG